MTNPKERRMDCQMITRHRPQEPLALHQVFENQLQSMELAHRFVELNMSKQAVSSVVGGPFTEAFFKKQAIMVVYGDNMGLFGPKSPKDEVLKLMEAANA